MSSNIIVDNLGRKIKLKEINGKARVAFYRALGAKDAANVGVTLEYWNVMAVDSIDDEPMGSIKALIDIETIHAKLEQSNAMSLIDEWLVTKNKEKQESEKEVVEHIKK